MNDMHENVERIMLSAEQIETRVKEVAAQLDKLYEGRRPVVVCILKGSVIFFADLIRSMKTPLELDFMGRFLLRNGDRFFGRFESEKGPHDGYCRAGRADRGRYHRFGKYPLQLEKTSQFPRSRQREYRHPPRQARTPRGADGAGIHLLRHRGRIRGGIRHGLFRRLPKSALHRGIETLRLRKIEVCKPHGASEKEGAGMRRTRRLKRRNTPLFAGNAETADKHSACREGRKVWQEKKNTPPTAERNSKHIL